MKKLTIKISGNEVMSVDDSDVFHRYNDLWKTALERANGHYQGTDASDNRNTTRIRVGAGNRDTSVAADKAITDALGNRFFIPLDFKLLESHMPFYKGALVDRPDYGSRLTTTTLCSRPQAMPTPHTLSEAYLSSMTCSHTPSWLE